MRGVSWDNMNMKPLKLEEITPEKLVEIDARAENVRLQQLTLAQLTELSKERSTAELALQELEWDCKIRAMRAYSLGFSKAELARIFNVPANKIKKWVEG